MTVVLGLACTIAPGWAQSPPPYLLNPLSNSYELGTRYWYSSGSFDKTLYDNTGSVLLSKLTYGGATGHAGEVYLNIADPNNWLLKGTVGIGRFAGGKLQDQDFNLPIPPFSESYSSTDSDMKRSSLNYASIDFGYYPLRGPRGKLGGFVGYHYLHEKLNAYGCTQTGGNTDICVPAIPTSVLVITQENMWHSLRVGVIGDVMLTPNFRLSGEAAYLPYVKLDGADWHWLRIGTDFNGPTPETGRGTGMQFEAILSYMVNEYFTVGVGGRYWRMSVPKGTAHFEQSAIGGGLQQVEKFKTERYGLFVQAGLKY
jgi:outer membrane protease